MAVVAARWNPWPAGAAAGRPLEPRAAGVCGWSGVLSTRSAGCDLAISSYVRSASSTETGVVSLALSLPIVTSRTAGAKPIISMRIDHTPSPSSANLNVPSASVLVTSFLSPWVAVTVAPGTTTPAKVT